MLTEEQGRQFASDGYVLVPGVVDETRLRAVDAEIDALVAGSPAPTGIVGAHFHFLASDLLPAADAALRNSGALSLANELVAPHHLDHAFDHIQVALNIPPYPHRPGAPHINYRLATEGHHARWADTFLDPFTEYASLRDVAPTEPFVSPPRQPPHP